MIRFFSNHPTAANVLMLLLLALGIYALPHLQRDTFPVTPATEVEIRAPYPGATPAEVEESVCQRLESALDSVPGMLELRCEARENLALLTARRTEAVETDTFYNDIKSQIEAVKTLPDKVETPSVVKLERVATVATVAITGPLDPESLLAYATVVQQRMQQDARLAQVTLQGFSERNLAIEISREALQRYGLSLGEVQAALLRQSVDLPGGVLPTPDSEWIVRFSGQRQNLQQWRELPLLAGPSGSLLRLGELAQLRLEFARPEEQTFFNGQRAALLQVAKTYDQDSLWVRGVLEEHLERERRLAPRGVELSVSADTTGNIRSRLRILIENGLQGLGLVLLTMALFFSVRFSFWVALGLPVSFLGAVFVMNLFGFTLNMMTLVGLLVATGLLMDDSIVIAENIAARLQEGKSPLEATVQGTQQVLPGVLASFVTTGLIVGPLSFLGGNMGAVLRYIPAVLLLTLAVSLIEAFLILPSHLRHALPSLQQPPQRWRQRFEEGFAAVRDRWFVPLALVAVRQPYLWLGTLLALALMAYATLPAGWLKFQAFPTLESDVIQARLLLPQGTPLHRTEELVAQLETALGQLDEEFSPRQPEEQRLVQNVSVFYNSNVDAFESGPHLATVSADLLPAEVREGTVSEMLERWRVLTGELPDVVSLKFTDRERGVAGKAIDLRLQGGSLVNLQQAAEDLKAFLSRFPGVRDVSHDLRPGKTELRVQLKDAAGVFGINTRSVAEEVRAALSGATGLEVLLRANAYDVVARLASEDRNSLDDLQNLRIRAPNGTLVPLSAVADLEITRGYARIHRVNGVKTVTVQGTLDPTVANAQELMRSVKGRWLPSIQERFPGLKLVSQGQDKESAETGSSLQKNLLFGVFGVFLLLAFQFGNLWQPLAVLLAVPAGFIGVVAGHLLLGLDLTMPSLVGLATLTGIVVNDNILLVAFLKQELCAGSELPAAAREAVRARFRPILLTSLTTIAGLLPLLLETSTQAQFLIPLVASLTFGLLAATFAALLVVPATFALLEDWNLLPEEATPYWT